MYALIKQLLFLFSPERAHHLTMKLWTASQRVPVIRALARSITGVKQVDDPVEWKGIRFANRVGLAAGFDKDARYLHSLQAMGFGFVEIGTLTPVGQPGNPKPRLFRLLKDRALINRMGFNNAGVDAAVERLKKRPEGLVVGGNIGKNKVTPLADAWKDYRYCFEKLYPYVDYFVVNVSSPNTPNLRELQGKDFLLKILNELVTWRSGQTIQRPILLKIAPDLSEGQLSDVVSTVKEAGIDGVIATNTTIDRSRLQTPVSTLESIGDGGLSGAPVKARSASVIRYIARKSDGTFGVVGVGGIERPEDAEDKIDAGAFLVQVYTGLIYQGPALVGEIAQHLKDVGKN